MEDLNKMGVQEWRESAQDQEKCRDFSDGGKNLKSIKSQMQKNYKNKYLEKL